MTMGTGCSGTSLLSNSETAKQRWNEMVTGDGILDEGYRDAGLVRVTCGDD